MVDTMEFRDLNRQYIALKNQIDESIEKVILKAQFIGGAEVRELEATLADYVGRKHCISCANGTDAISIALISAGVGDAGGGSKKDVVFVPDFTFFSSGECPASVGAVPIFVDVDRFTYNISALSLEKSIKAILEDGKLVPRAVIAVDLFGQPFNYNAIKSICKKYNLILIEDAAQGFGGYYVNQSGEKLRAGKLGNISTTSFFPAKPLGCYGDGGAIFTDDDDIATLCRSIAVHGKDMEHPDDPYAKYNNIRLGYNSRLDTIQASILLAKFDVFKNQELARVNQVAKKYINLLKELEEITIPAIESNCFSSWAQFTIQISNSINRLDIQSKLKDAGIPTNIYYIKPMHRQGAFCNTRSAVANCPNTEALCNTVLCLPIHPYIEDQEVSYVCDKLIKSIGDSVKSIKS